MLEAAPDFPPVLQALFEGDHPLSAEFHRHIRNYNGALAFASVVSSVQAPPGRGPYVFRVSGQVYHFLAPARPRPGESPTFGQLYFLDTAEARDVRASHPSNSALSRDLLDILDGVLRETSPFAQLYLQMRQVEAEENGRASQEDRPPMQVQMVFDTDRRLDRRRYNAPTANEIAAIMVGPSSGPMQPHRLVVHSRGDGLQTIRVIDPRCDPMCYPLLFPRGEEGWKIGMPRGRGRNVSMLEYYAYMVAPRRGFSAILAAGPLFQQYVVDAYVKVETTRLDFQRYNQDKLRAESYRGLTDHLAAAADVQGVVPGRMIILASSFQGGPRAMQQSYQDAMAICRKFGKPDIFLTITCNPQWSEIVQSLLPGQTAADRPDIVAKVFKLKVDMMLDDLLKRHVLGRIVAHSRVIEFQKRGLPHCHMLLILAEEDKPREPEHMDRIVSCEIPDPIEHPRLHAIVQKTMLHGPCGHLNPTSPCMDGETVRTCTKGFPKELCRETTASDHGFPKYRRRDNGRTMMAGPHEVDNRWIVPHNPYLLLKYNAHINVEICCSVKSFKYIYKYIYKGHDCARVRMQTVDGRPQEVLEHDEIRAFQESRYISAPEAYWRLSEYPMQEKSHTVTRLPVHLPDEQTVYFAPGREREAVNSERARTTMLTAWFQLNEHDEEARSIAYHDIPLRYVYNDRTHVWTRRQQHARPIIGRMYTVGPRDMERYCLRLLLLHTPGACSYEGLRTVAGEVCATFHEAASRRELLEDDSEWTRCLAEAVHWQMPRELRQLFVTVLIWGSPRSPAGLWEQCKLSLSEDYARSHDPDTALLLAYNDVDDRMRPFQKTLFRDYRIVPPSAETLAIRTDQVDRDEETRLGQEMFAQLNASQRSAAEEVLAAIEGRTTTRCFFVDGPGGTGKTFLYRTLCHILAGRGVPVLTVAWTGIAANLLPNGTTLHSRFKLPLALDERSTLQLSGSSAEAEVIRRAAIVVWDEAPMASGQALQVIEAGLRDLMQSQEPFGGKIMLLGGDFRQVLPVVRRGSRAAQVGASLKRSHLWALFRPMRLAQNMRVEDGQDDFSAWLLQLGDGRLPAVNDEVDIPSHCIVAGSLVADIFGEQVRPEDTERLYESVILCATNKDSLALNEDVVQRLPGTAKSYFSVDKAVVEEGDDPTAFPEEFLYTLTPNGLPPHRLTLKVGAVVMLLRNLDVNQGLCNGARMIVRRMHDHVLDCELMSGAVQGRRVLIPRIKLQPTGDALPFDFTRKQFPVRPAFAMTINKAQGQTFKRVGLLLEDPVFSHGQLYVAFSRVRSFAAVRVKLAHGATRTKNVVYREIFD